MITTRFMMPAAKGMPTVVPGPKKSPNAPAGYDAKAYARDLAIFKPFLKEKSPATILLGPGGVGEGGMLAPVSMKTISSADILVALVDPRVKLHG